MNALHFYLGHKDYIILTDKIPRDVNARRDIAAVAMYNGAIWNAAELLTIKNTLFLYNVKPMPVTVTYGSTPAGKYIKANNRYACLTAFMDDPSVIILNAGGAV